MAVDNVHFYHFNNGNEKYFCIYTCSQCDDCKPGGRTVKTSNLQFTNVTSFIHFNSPNRYILEDEDGSLTGFPTCGWAIPYYQHNLVPDYCEDRRWDYGGIICDCNVIIRKVEFQGDGVITKKSIKIIRLDDGVDIETASSGLWSTIFF